MLFSRLISVAVLFLASSAIAGGMKQAYQKLGFYRHEIEEETRAEVAESNVLPTNQQEQVGVSNS